MSARAEKAKRRAARAELGIDKTAEREMHEFEGEIARVKAGLIADTEIVSRQPRRRTLAIAALVIVAALLAAVAGGLR